MLILIIFSGTTVSYAGCAKSVNLGADYKEKRGHHTQNWKKQGMSTNNG